jgi:hypothetical protein
MPAITSETVGRNPCHQRPNVYIYVCSTGDTQPQNVERGYPTSFLRRGRWEGLGLLFDNTNIM